MLSLGEIEMKFENVLISSKESKAVRKEVYITSGLQHGPRVLFYWKLKSLNRCVFAIQSKLHLFNMTFLLSFELA